MDKNKVIFGILILLGLTAQGFLIGRSFQRFRKEDRSIAVKGFAEKEVKANFAVWTIKTRVLTNELSSGTAQIEANKNKIKEFLTKYKVKPEEIVQQELNVTDKLAQDYSGNYIGEYRYVIENSMQVRSNNVDNVQQISRRTDELLKSGINVSTTNEYRPAVQYLFTELNKIKPEMLSEATKNAKQAAEQFTKDGEVSLGKIKKASQGLFSIVDRDESNAGGEGGYYPSSVNDIYKKVRVVVNVEYTIE